MQPLPPTYDCYCTFGPSWQPFCPLHGADPQATAIENAMPDPFHGYTTPPLYDTNYPFSDFSIQDLGPIGLDSDLTVYVGHHIGQTPVVRDTSMLPFGPTPPATFHPQGPSIGSIPTEGWDNSAHHDPSHGNQISPVNQTAIISGWNSSPAPISIEKESWYSQYGINRDADGWFHCPHAGCIDKKKRRDQLWEHWKARHNNDPYRCSSCRSTWTYNGEKSHSCTAEMTTCQICNKPVTRHHLSDHQKTRGCRDKRRDDDISVKVIDSGGSL